MGVEAVHRALARQSLGLLGNDRAFIRFRQPESAEGAPDLGRPGFTDVREAFVRLEAAGIGFDKRTSVPGQFYDFTELRKRTLNPPGSTPSSSTDTGSLAERCRAHPGRSRQLRPGNGRSSGPRPPRRNSSARGVTRPSGRDSSRA